MTGVRICPHPHLDRLSLPKVCSIITTRPYEITRRNTHPHLKHLERTILPTKVLLVLLLNDLVTHPRAPCATLFQLQSTPHIVPSRT